MDSEEGTERRKNPVARFSSADEHSVLQVGEDLIAVNQISSYKGWENYKPLVLEALEAYKTVVGPDHFHVLALAFANSFTLPDDSSTLDEYLKLHPVYGDSTTFDSFSAEVALSYENKRDILYANVHSGYGNTDQATNVSLVLTYVTGDAHAISINDFEAWLDVAHTRIKEVFDNSLSAKVKETFEPIETSAQ